MRNPFRKDGSVAKAEKLIADLEANQVELRKKRDVVQKLLDGHKSALRDFVRANPSEDIPAELRHSLSIAKLHLESLGETLAEGDEQLVELRQALVFEQERGEREAAAAKLEAVAKAIDAAGADLKAAMAAAGKAAAAIEKALPDDLVVFELHDESYGKRPRYRTERGPVSRREMVAMILAEGLVHVAPDAFDTKYGYEQRLVRFFNLAGNPVFKVDLRPDVSVDAATAARQVISDRLRARAAAILAGEAAPETDDVAPKPLVEPEPEAQPDVAVFVVEHFSYVSNWAGGLTLCGRNTVRDVPAQVAEQAIARSLALPVGDPAALAKLAELDAVAVNVPYLPTADECEPLGDLCGFLDRPDELEAAE